MIRALYIIQETQTKQKLKKLTCDLTMTSPPATPWRTVRDLESLQKSFETASDELVAFMKNHPGLIVSHSNDSFGSHY
jgi:hypothetical protein